MRTIFKCLQNTVLRFKNGKRVFQVNDFFQNFQNNLWLPEGENIT
jgi:hypothetical protein